VTTIIGIQGADYALVCSDSRITSMDEGGFASQMTTLGPNSAKIAENGKYLLGAAGDVRAINLLHHVFVPPVIPPKTSGKKLDNFITNKFIPSLRDCFEKHGYSAQNAKDSSPIAEQGSTIMIVASGSIYVIENDYSWTSDSYGLYAIGTGSAYALGALQILNTPNPMTLVQAKRNSLKAINIAAKYDPYTGAPFNCYNQSNS